MALPGVFFSAVAQRPSLRIRPFCCSIFGGLQEGSLAGSPVNFPNVQWVFALACQRQHRIISTSKQEMTAENVAAYSSKKSPGLPCNAQCNVCCRRLCLQLCLEAPRVPGQGSLLVHEPEWQTQFRCLQLANLTTQRLFLPGSTRKYGPY